MFTYPNPFSFQGGFGNTPWNWSNSTPNYGGSNWNQYGWNTPYNYGWNNWQNGQSPVNCGEGFCGTGCTTPSFGYTPWMSAFNTPWNYNTPWNGGWNSNNMPFQNTVPFPGLYNFSNSFAQGSPFGQFPFSYNNTIPFGSNANFAQSSYNAPFNWSQPQACGAAPFMSGFNTPWNYGGMPFFGGFGWNTPIFWGQYKGEGEVVGKKGEVNVTPKGVAPYPVGFGPFVPFGYPNGDFVKNGVAPACAA